MSSGGVSRRKTATSPGSRDRREGALLVTEARILEADESRAPKRRTRQTLVLSISLVVAIVTFGALHVASLSRQDEAPSNNSRIESVAADKVVAKLETRRNALGFKPLLVPNVTDPWKRTLFGRLDQIQSKCGELCSINDIEKLQQHSQAIKGAHFPLVRIPVDCPALLGLEEIDAGDQTFPGKIPDELLGYYTLGGAYSAIHGRIYTEGYLEGDARFNVWTKESIEADIQRAKNGTLQGSYRVWATNNVRRKLSQVILTDKSVLVIGSERPWVEAICLSLGARKVTTLEYGTIKSHHPQIETVTPHTFRDKFMKGELGTYDGVVSFSSVEHAGLGRYGDALNPWGDILTVARAWCVTKKGGFMYMGLPTGNDTLKYNANRIYGSIRWPLVTANWIQVDGSDSDGKELLRGLRTYQAGGWGYIFRKVDPDDVVI